MEFSLPVSPNPLSLSLSYSGVVAFFGLGVYYLTRPLTEIQVQEKIVFACFFAGAMVCMGLSFLYHTLCCHNNKAIGRLFAKYVIHMYIKEFQVICGTF